MSEESKQNKYLLSPEERKRFSAWLLMEASVSEELMVQMKKLNVAAAFLDRERIYVAAARVVANRLTTGEDVTIG